LLFDGWKLASEVSSSDARRRPAITPILAYASGYYVPRRCTIGRDSGVGRFFRLRMTTPIVDYRARQYAQQADRFQEGIEHDFFLEVR
jgi:hypothetical protein